MIQSFVKYSECFTYLCPFVGIFSGVRPRRVFGYFVYNTTFKLVWTGGATPAFLLVKSLYAILCIALPGGDAAAAETITVIARTSCARICNRKSSLRGG